MRILLVLALLPASALAGIVSFRSDFPDPKLRGESYDVRDRDFADALRLRSSIYLKQAEIDAFVRSCPPNSKNWREEAQHWNALRAENWRMMQELRAIVARAY